MKGGGETYSSKLWPLELGPDQQCGAHGLTTRKQAARGRRGVGTSGCHTPPHRAPELLLARRWWLSGEEGGEEGSYGVRKSESQAHTQKPFPLCTCSSPGGKGTCVSPRLFISLTF